MSVLKVEIRTVDVNGKPTNVVLATSNSIDVEDINRDAFYYFTFNSPVSVISGTQKYAIVLLKSNDYYYSNTSEIGWVYSDSLNPYADGIKWEYDGSTWTSSNNTDQYFKVFYNLPQTPTLIENSWNFNQDNCNKFFVSTDNTMELDMRFHISFCIDGSGSMSLADPNSLRISETLLFIKELLRRSPFSYVDIWSFGEYITEDTYDGPTKTKQDYNAALGSIDSSEEDSRLWDATDQAVGNLDPSSIVSAIIRDSYTDEVLDLMRQMNRINYADMESIDADYDSSTGFNGIANYGNIVNYIINDYASTMGGVGIVMSDGYDNSIDYDIEDIILTANSIKNDYWTPIYCFALGNNYKNEEMYELSNGTMGSVYQLGQNINTRLRESFNELLNDNTKTIFQGYYEDEVWFDELTFLSNIELGAIIPATTSLKFEISISYDGLSFEEWEEVPANSLYSIEKFIIAFKIKISGWLGNIYGGNYYDIYGSTDSGITDQDSFTILCKYANYYGYDNYQYYTTTDEYYYYRSSDYPSPKIYSLRYWTVDPSITYKFTEPQDSPVISEYMFSPNIDLPEKAIINYGIVRGDSTDPEDLIPIISNRMGILPNRKYSLYYTPDIHQIGLSTVAASQTSNGVVIHRVVDSSGETVTWTDTDIVVVKVNGYAVDPTIVNYQLIGEQGLIQWFDSPRPTTDVVTVDITTPGSSHTRKGELATSDNRRIYYVSNGSWPWDATVTVRINDSIISSGFIVYPEEGSIFFLKELKDDDVVTLEIQHKDCYRIGYQIKSYTNDEIDNPDFGFVYSEEAATETLEITSVTVPPIIQNLLLSPELPSLTDRIIVTYDFYQEDNNAENGTTIKWYVRRYGTSTFVNYSNYDNRNVMRTSDVPASNTNGPFQKYDSWYVIVTPKDINSTGTPVQSNTVNIGGYIPPYIESATVVANTGDQALSVDDNGILNAIEQDLVASYVYYDPNTNDSDSDSSLIEWYQNGQSIASYSSIYPDTILPSTYVKSGQVWTYVVTPYDGNNYGYKFESDEVIITQSKS